MTTALTSSGCRPARCSWRARCATCSSTPETLKKRSIPELVRAGLEQHLADAASRLMLHLRIVAPPDLADRVVELLCELASVLNVVRLRRPRRSPRAT